MGKQKNEFTGGDRVRSTIRMLIPQDKQSEALEILGRVRDQVQFEPHCLSSRLYRSVDEEGAIMLEELWKDGHNMLEHLRSDAYRRVLLVVEMAEEPPDIRFDTIAGSGGVEVIELARRQG
jgi:quinol monooxygenase YgiN